MKRFALLALSLLPLGAATNAQLTQVQAVYIMPMAHSMDQYLANHLTKLALFRIVADPQKADALMTDRLGEGFEKRLTELYPPPPDPKKDPKSKEAKDKENEKRPDHFSTFGRGKGTVFLVDRKSLDVVWSIYDRPKNGSPDELNHIASQIASKLAHDLKGK